MAALAKENPLDTRELTQRVMQAKGLNDGDKVMARVISLRIVQTLRLKRTKLDVSEKRKDVSVWRLKTYPASSCSPQQS
jgi:hypothetical protein